jgi:hypothetical protein
MSGNPNSVWSKNGSRQHRRYKDNYSDNNTDNTGREVGLRGATESQVFTFNDVEVGTRVLLRGKPGVVVDKGNLVESGQVGHHIKIQYYSGGGEQTRRVHEAMVNKYIRKKKELWIDFGNRVSNYVPDDNGDDN